MLKKIDVYVNGAYEFSTMTTRNCSQVVRDVRNTKHIMIASVPENRYLTVYDYDKVAAHYSKR